MCGFLQVNKQGRIERALMAQKIESAAGSDLVGAIGGTDPLALAYLWLAVELNYNIIAFHRSGNVGRMMDKLIQFIPRYHIVMDISRDNKVCRGINFSKLVDKEDAAGIIPCLDQIGIVNGRRKRVRNLVDAVLPDRIIERSADSLGLLFSRSKYGTSFIASVTGDFHNRSIVKSLRSRHFGIGANEISALDISVVLDDDSSIRHITEYRWIERAEIKVIEKGFAPKAINNISIMSEKKLNEISLDASKVIESYAKSNLVSTGFALKELYRRKDFLVRIARDGSLKANPIEAYYEIA